MSARRKFRKNDRFYFDGLAGDIRMDLVNAARGEIEDKLNRYLATEVVDSLFYELMDELESLDDSNFDGTTKLDNIVDRIMLDAIEDVKLRP